MCPDQALLVKPGWSPACLLRRLTQAVGHGGTALMKPSQEGFPFEKGFPY